MNRWFGYLALIALFPGLAAAQDSTAVARPAPAVTLSLQEALDQARANSPTYRQTLNDANPARWGVKNAYGSLLPSVSVGSDVGYTGSGQSSIGGGLVLPTSAFYTSGYDVSLQWQLNGRTITAPAEQKALQHATDEDISGAGITLRSEITTQYLTTLQATAQVAVARQQVTRNVDFLTLAKARYQVGQATLLDVRQAEVTKGQSDVALLRAVQAENEAGEMDPPDYLAEQLEEYQGEHWDAKEEREKLQLAIDYGQAEIDLEAFDEDQEEMDLTEEEKESPEIDELYDLVRSGDPKSIWKIADSSLGKKLLLNSGWSGVLNLKDPESYARFKAYVGRVKKGQEEKK